MFTVPNILSFIRLLGVPVFFWLIVGPKADTAALIVLFASGATDWLDGFLARKLNQFSRIGELLDPLADRLYIVATLLALFVRGILPIWVLVVLLARDLFMLFVLGQAKRLGFTGLPVHFVGKAATMNLLYALPLLLLGTYSGWIGQISHIIGWAFLLWGIAMYWYAGYLYLSQLRQIRTAVAE